MFVQNTSFTFLKITDVVFWLECTYLKLGPALFAKIQSAAIICLLTSEIEIENSVKFTHNQGNYCIIMRYIKLKEHSRLEIIANNFSVVFYAGYGHDRYNIMCLFQYEKSIQRAKHNQIQHHNYSILLKENHGDLVSNKRFPFSHCEWTEKSFYRQSDPFEVNMQIIHFVNNSLTLTRRNPNVFCYCTDDQHYNCSIYELGPFHPGQTFSLNIFVDNHNNMEVNINKEFNRACKSHNINKRILLISETCTKIEYKSILYMDGNSCNIYLDGMVSETESVLINESFELTIPQVLLNVYEIRISPCPLGFALNEILKICQCDPTLKTLTISPDGCYIDTQTIPRPANSWITGRTNVDNNSHTYQVSSHCPFDYCLPHSSHLNLSNPDSQCQFNRIGVLCGRCKEGLSTVLGTSQCKQCSNYYLFLLIAFIFVGIVSVIFLFISNFTVANGNINGIIFYANIVSINGSVFFPSYEPTKYVYVLTSFLNLDLGIEVCFYNGMDDYAKMWLQLIFPIYLIFIATLLIITSRYSTRIQRLTAHRALPVLATLFLLSYTKILRTVSSVLFSYSTITSLPSKKTTLVWSVDTEVQLFGLKFIFLFIVCLVLFLMLLPFNTVLIFTRTLSQFKCINHFKPLLDAYQGPYKDRFYYWTGLQLLLRAVFYVISALDRNTNMMIGILILGVMECVHGTYRPYKSKAKNRQELLLVFNLQVLFAVSLYTTSNSIAINILVGIAMVKFVSFTLYQMAWCRQATNTVLTVLFARLMLSKYFSFMKSNSAITQQDLQLLNVVPEVAYNYKEFQEPLIGQDK
ncbi:uncharacterized protein [Dysidea avara]|uniref:uncharacterized protein n=1 Tax=Dysidea avara TaxID=196820 RepID=UPI003316D3AB